MDYETSIMDFTNLQNTINKLQAFKAAEEVPLIIDDNQESIVQSMREQLIEGLDKQGKPRADQYRPFTKAYKRMFGIGPGAIIDHVTFFMTGTLSESLYYKREGDLFSVLSPLETYQKMIDRIGADEYGLDPERRLYIATEKILPQFKKVFKEKTNFNM